MMMDLPFYQSVSVENSSDVHIGDKYEIEEIQSLYLIRNDSNQTPDCVKVRRVSGDLTIHSPKALVNKHYHFHSSNQMVWRG